MTGDETFLGRWSRRKQAARTGKAEADEPQMKAPAGAPSPSPSPSPSGVPGETKAPPDLPPIESLGKDSDYAPFLRDDVPADLRRQALNRLWASDPAFAAPDPLDLYNLDHRPPPLAEAVATLFRVGRGMVDPEPPAPESAGDRKADRPKPTAGGPQAELPTASPSCSETHISADFSGIKRHEQPDKKS